MEIRIVDFEKVTKHFITYQNGMTEIKKVRNEFKNKVEPIRKEMQNIIAQSSSGLVLDTLSQQERSERFQKLQQELVNIDNDYKHEMNEMHGKLNVKSYDELEVLITEWAKENSIDLISSKMEVIFVSEKFDVTSDIIELLKTKELYSEPLEEQKVEN
jgi:Skp family chaperone for outer membrane proteins